MIRTNQKLLYAKDLLVEMLEIPLEFEVWARIIKDSEGNDIQVFIKEDKVHKLRKDSSFYYDGSWNVFEFDDISKEVSLRTSWGTRSLRKYDYKDRLTENYLIDEKGDTLISEQYKWKNGRLIRMVENGIMRTYIYGNSLIDTIRVVPSDKGIRSHSGYNGTAGKIPEESEPQYKYFTRDPYGYTYEKKEQTAFSTLFKLPSGGTPSFFCPEINGKYGMPPVECIRYTKEYISREANRNYPYPNKRDTLLYGESHAEPLPPFPCECIGGKYHIKPSDTTTNEYLQVMKSGWRYIRADEDWKEYCWTKNEMQSTYDHEVMHIRNARDIVRELSKKHFKDIISDTESECEANSEAKFTELAKAWDIRYLDEQKHKGDKWKGVTYGGYRVGNSCSN